MPDNALNSSALESLLDAGVLGLKVDIMNPMKLWLSFQVLRFFCCLRLT